MKKILISLNLAALLLFGMAVQADHSCDYSGCAIWGDFDNDGLIDLFIANFDLATKIQPAGQPSPRACQMHTGRKLP